MGSRPCPHPTGSHGDALGARSAKIGVAFKGAIRVNGAPARGDRNRINANSRCASGRGAWLELAKEVAGGAALACGLQTARRRIVNCHMAGE